MAIEAPDRVPRVKICGIMKPEHAIASAEAGADMIGLVFAPSKRKINLEQARSIVEAARSGKNSPLLVGVFVNEAARRISEMANQLRLDIVQLSGDETPETVENLAHEFRVFKSLRFTRETTLDAALRTAVQFTGGARGHNVRLLLDTHRTGEYGGTGEVGDWLLARRIAEELEIVLAGGLDPSNVARSLQAVRPWGVDVSSGVEKNGIKSVELIRSFIQEAKKKIDIERHERIVQ